VHIIVTNDKCCRVGNLEDVFHCDECGIGLLISSSSNHVCTKINEEDPCPICLNALNTHGESIVLLKCYHTMHDSCLELLIENTDKSRKIPCCTICKMSVVDHRKYERRFDEYCRQSEATDWEKYCIL